MIQILDRNGERVVIHSDPDICLHSPMLVKSRSLPRVIPDTIDPEHAAVLFSAPVFYRHLFDPGSATTRWITDHIDKTAALLREAGATEVEVIPNTPDAPGQAA